MKRYKRLFSESLQEDAFEWIQSITLTSRTNKPSSSIINYLKKFPIDKKPLYRGIGLVTQRIDKKYISEVNSLKEGDLLPDYLVRPTGIGSYTKKLSVAKTYSEGKLSIIVQTESYNRILVDLEFFAKQLKKENNLFFDKEDLLYMIKDKEVLMIEPTISKIISITGKL